MSALAMREPAAWAATSCWRLRPSDARARLIPMRFACSGLLWCVMAVNLFSQPSPYQDRFATVNGLRIHYLDWGNAGKPPFLMLHGIARHAHSFDHIAPHFRDNYHVIAMDMRGHGDSDWSPDGAYLVEDYVKDVEGLV